MFAWLLVIFAGIGTCSASCYFSIELQGSFVTQGTVANHEIQYSQVNITEDSIPIWGVCQKRIENNVILMISSEETTCFRCFNLKLVSRNVLRARTTDSDYISKCYANEEKAIASCPTEEILKDSSLFTEIILYKHYDAGGQEIRREYCPINGRYKLNYNVDDGQEDFMECSTMESELDNCPSGSAMNLRFRKCSFEDHEITFECLGHWEDENNQKYLALMNSSPAKDKLGPQYRCAIYSEDPVTGNIVISFSKDSTCSAINKSINDNKAEVPHTEMLTLYPAVNVHWPHDQFCTFPEWLQGHFEHITVKNDTLIFRDQTSFKTYTMKCIANISDYILVFSRTQCDEEIYQCIQIKDRSPNIVELQIGTELSRNYSEAICSSEHFNSSQWLTQGRLDQKYKYTPCPVSGEFRGVIPDATTLCAKLSSECTSEDIMYHEVSACEYGEVYEERKYQCLGQWTENDVVYAYTKRLDVGTYECFVGAMTPENKIFLKEAGENCQRNVNPYRFGMEIHQTSKCKRTPKPITTSTTTTFRPTTVVSTTSPSAKFDDSNAIHPVTTAPESSLSSEVSPVAFPLLLATSLFCLTR
ncbi:unnamed protein product [Hermetia illucens]|uniref:Uncharacterized protein n=2 Tax=Hermetia illucens TaxID=343691 RepID=A0A7R8YTX5_HERIL|nr:unnamed protein product [Hermetia illucens]